MVNEALNNYITLMNFAYVLSRETDQSNRMNHTTVTDKHLGGLHLRKKSTFGNQRPTRMCRMFLNVSFTYFSSLSLKNRGGSNFCQKRETATRHDVIFISTSFTRCCMVKTTNFPLLCHGTQATGQEIVSRQNLPRKDAIRLFHQIYKEVKKYHKNYHQIWVLLCSW